MAYSAAAGTDRADRKAFFLPVLGFIWLYPEEVAITNHPAFQRLSKINQLGQTYFVFRGATHKRIEHVLGAAYVAGKMIKAIQYNCEKHADRGEPGAPPVNAAAPLSNKEERFVRLGALGHLAAGHTLEDELCLIGKHDEDTRIEKIFREPRWFDGDESGSLGRLIDNTYAAYVPETLKQKGVTASQICQILIRKPPPKGKDTLADAHGHVSQSHELRLRICSNIIGNTICADLLDYLYSDWYHIGKIRSVDDRIFQYMEVRYRSDSQYDPVFGEDGLSLPRRPDDEFVIALGNRSKIRTDGVSAILGLLEWRYELAEVALYHRTMIAAAAMMDRAFLISKGSRSVELWKYFYVRAMTNYWKKQFSTRKIRTKSGRRTTAGLRSSDQQLVC
jgi:HD superfamily phosphohydrolase